ncbi:hypothetical protein L873DRAFT_202249 [Choiromyces venosus 120613-1]|uniref:Uncharacterized protein n=1 Tax=Choiromyces venosus 120613-1 TaxID=1336337 RepID=A0A3N4J285_9PEZI|nr:hypothetical protein L873DRAFT_202249 [Choiromyces venosus 120613-1]
MMRTFEALLVISTDYVCCLFICFLAGGKIVYKGTGSPAGRIQQAINPPGKASARKLIILLSTSPLDTLHEDPLHLPQYRNLK